MLPGITVSEYHFSTGFSKKIMGAFFSPVFCRFQGLQSSASETDEFLIYMYIEKLRLYLGFFFLNLLGLTKL